ncbi:MAG: hypothetical protein KF852_16140 [Saprospiraceae bacterium]|nr:hypothetical protein [Saprospiraceae bacterium]
MNNEIFWKTPSDQFVKAEKMLHEMAKAHGLDLNAITPEEWEQTGREIREREEQSEQHPISMLATRYSKTAHTWLRSHALRQKADDAIQAIELGIRSIDEGEQEVIQMKECLDIMQWYLHFIPVKCMRAVSEAHEDDFWEELPPSERSYNGTAKITLIAIERSIKAWTLLLDMIPGEEDALIGLLATLQRLQRMLEEAFPDAQRFIRPGFDE